MQDGQVMPEWQDENYVYAFMWSCGCVYGLQTDDGTGPHKKDHDMQKGDRVERMTVREGSRRHMHRPPGCQHR